MKAAASPPDTAPAGASARSGADSAVEAHRIPVIDKAVQILELLRADGRGLTINELVGATAVARSTVYRILNTLVSHHLTARRSDGRYTLGMGLLALAAGVDTDLSDQDLVEQCHERIVALAEQTGETCKLSVLHDLRAEVIDVAQSPNELAPTSRVGSSFLLHAGAASKLLLAFQPSSVLDRLFAQPLPALTPHTIVERQALERELEMIRRDRLSFDRGEWNVNVHAVAAPVFGHGGVLLAALSATHFATGDEDERRARVILPLVDAARSLSESLGDREGSSGRDVVPATQRVRTAAKAA